MEEGGTVDAARLDAVAAFELVELVVWFIAGADIVFADGVVCG